MAWGPEAQLRTIELHRLGRSEHEIVATVRRESNCDDKTVRRCIAGLDLLREGATGREGVLREIEEGALGEEAASIAHRFQTHSGTEHYLRDLRRVYEAIDRPAILDVDRTISALRAITVSVNGQTGDAATFFFQHANEFALGIRSYNLPTGLTQDLLAQLRVNRVIRLEQVPGLGFSYRSVHELRHTVYLLTDFGAEVVQRLRDSQGDQTPQPHTEES